LNFCYPKSTVAPSKTMMQLSFFMILLVTNVLAAYNTRILETGTTFLPENNGVWTMADFSGTGKLDLIYIKNQNTPSGRVEVHVASQDSNYQTRVFEQATVFANELNGVWMVGDFSNTGRPDLIYIKTSNTGTNTVEVHVASAASNYQTIVYAGGSTFGPENNGVWTMADTTGNGKLDLVYIKTEDTDTEKIEIHIASGASNYQTRIVETGTVFQPSIAPVCTWLIHHFTTPINQDLGCIQFAQTPQGRVEVQIAAGSQNYQTLSFQSPTTFADEDNGTWLLGDYTHNSHPDLIYIKTSNTDTCTVEVHISPY